MLFLPSLDLAGGCAAGMGLWVFLQCASRWVDFCLQLAGKPSVLSRSTSNLSSPGCLLVESALVAFNCSTCARKIAADAWEREQGSCLLKKVQLQSSRERGRPGKETPFPLNPTHSTALGVIGPYLGYCSQVPQSWCIDNCDL